MQGFKEFIMKGNVLDLAVAVIIGGAFGQIVTSMVNDLIMPAMAVVTGGLDFSNLFASLDGNEYATLAAAQDAGAAALAYGNFINAIINFMMIAAAVYFFLVRPAKKLAPAEEAAEEPAGPSTEDLLVEIRDLLKERA